MYSGGRDRKPRAPIAWRAARTKASRATDRRGLDTSSTIVATALEFMDGL